MRKQIKSLMNTKFFRNVVVMILGTAGAQLISLVLTPIITRIYGPEAYGIMGTFTALTRILTPIVALTYPVAIVLPESDIVARNIVRLSIRVSIITAAISGIIIIILKQHIIMLLNLEEISIYLLFIPLVIVFTGIMQVTENWLIRTNQFKVSAKASFYQSLVINGSKVGVGFIYPFASVLIILNVISNAVRSLIMYHFMNKSKILKTKTRNKEAHSLKQLAKKYIDFPKYRAPEELFSSISQSLPLLMLTSMFGVASTGFYNIGYTVLSLPSNLVGKSIGDVFYPRITKALKNGEKGSKLLVKATVGLIFIGIIPFGLVILFGPTLFKFVFGTEWLTAGEYARWIAISSFSTLFIIPSIKSMPVLNAQKLLLIFTIIRLFMRAVGLLLGFTIFKSDIIAIALFSLFGFIMNVILFVITMKMFRDLEKINGESNG